MLDLLQQASQCQVDKVLPSSDHMILLLHHIISQMNYDLVDYLNELRDGCLEAYTGIVQGLRGPDSKNYNR